MLSRSITEKKRVYAICEKSGDIRPGDTFHGLFLAERDDRLPSGLAQAKIICCGKVSDEELLFRTGDGRYYFSIRDGWGEADGVLYGIRIGVYYDFRHPTTVETILAECETCLETYRVRARSFITGMIYRSHKRTLDAICAVMKTAEKE